MKIEGDPNWRNYLTVGRDVYRKHPAEFTADEWDYVREFIALALLEQEENGNGDDEGLPGE